MSGQQFSEKAGKLLDRINCISFRQKKQKLNQQTLNFVNRGGQINKPILSRTINISPSITSPQTQTVLQLIRIQQDLVQSQEQNCRKIKNLNEEIRKLESFLRQENQMRVKMHQNFINSVVKAEKNMQMTLSNIKKTYTQRQKKLQMKIEQVLKQQKKQVLQQIQSNESIQENLNKLKHNIQSLRQQLIQMKRTRLQLEDKISKQFNDQISDLKAVFAKSIKMREEKELKILQMLKNLYKKHMQSIKRQEVQRQSNEKMFLTVIEQLIDRITQA